MSEIKPYQNTKSKKEQIEEMFDNISENYDFLNGLLSFNIDNKWRNKLEKKVVKLKPSSILDVATGTGDLAILHAKKTNAHITGFDLSQKMLDVGAEKIKKEGFQDRISLVKGDAEGMPFDDNSFDVITASFGVRNFENLEKGLTEMNRVLNPGGTVLILEFSKPSSIFAPLFLFYFNKVLPAIGKLISQDNDAYKYLPNSVDKMPSGKEMTTILENSGFVQTSFKELTFGVATIYKGIK